MITSGTKARKNISRKRNNVGNWAQDTSVDSQPEEKGMDAGRSTNKRVIKIVQAWKF